MPGIYRSREGEREMESLYEEALRRLPPGCEGRFVRTGFGETHVLCAGPEEAPPVVVLPGGNFLGPLCLAWFAPLARRYRLLLPEIVGQPGRSAPRRLSPRGDEQARWTAEVLDGLGLGSVAIVGVSYGAGLVLRLAGYAPERISRAALVSPSGLVLGSLPRMVREVALPMMLYRLLPTRERLLRASHPILTDPGDDLYVRQLGAVYRHVRLDTGIPRRATAGELAGFRAPVMLFAAERDPFFPGARVAERARETIPNPVSVEVLAGSRHVPSPPEMERVNARILPFLDGGA